MGWRGRGTHGPWPGRGQFSHLPPWQRPGWLYGPGSCRWLFRQGLAPSDISPRSPTENVQITTLEAYKKEIAIELKEINQEIEKLKKSGLNKTKE